MQSQSIFWKVIISNEDFLIVNNTMVTCYSNPGDVSLSNYRFESTTWFSIDLHYNNHVYTNFPISCWLLSYPSFESAIQVVSKYYLKYYYNLSSVFFLSYRLPNRITPNSSINFMSFFVSYHQPKPLFLIFPKCKILKVLWKEILFQISKFMYAFHC